MSQKNFISILNKNMRMKGLSGESLKTLSRKLTRNINKLKHNAESRFRTYGVR